MCVHEAETEREVGVWAHVSRCTCDGLSPLCGVNSLFLSFHLYLGSRDQTQILSLARKHLYPLSHPTSMSLLVTTLPPIK